MRRSATLKFAALALCAIALTACGTTTEVTATEEEIPVVSDVSAGTDVETEPEDEIELAAEPDSSTEAAAATEEAVETTSESGVTVYAHASFIESSEYTKVEEALLDLASDGCTAGVVLRDLETGYSMSYNADALLYPASSIKALWCASLYEARGGADGMAKNVTACIEESSNEDYQALVDKFGNKDFKAWLEGLGVSKETVEEACTHTYPHISANDMALAWTEIYRYGTSGEQGADELTGHLASTKTTAIGEALRSKYTVWCKAGWFPADENDLPTTADAGVVFSSTGSYVLVILTNKPSDLPSLEPLVEALDAAHDAMCLN